MEYQIANLLIIHRLLNGGGGECSAPFAVNCKLMGVRYICTITTSLSKTRGGIVSVKGGTPIFIYIHLLLYHEFENLTTKNLP